MKGMCLCSVMAVAVLSSLHAGQVKLPITRDTSIRCHESEKEQNDGAATGIKLKSYQHLMLTDFECGKLRGKVVTGAVLHVHYTGAKGRYADYLRRVGCSTVASSWGEGEGRGKPFDGGACMVSPFYPDKDWAWPGSDITAVIFGQGHTIYSSSDAAEPDGDGWQTVRIAPEIIRACVAGISHGVVFFDDLGSDWRVEGNKVIKRHMPNRVVHSREQSQWQPYLTITTEGEDDAPPAAVRELSADSEGLEFGRLRLTWQAPEDAMGYIVRYSDERVFNWDSAAEVPRYLVPMAAEPGAEQSMVLRDLELDPGKTCVVGIRPVDGAGNSGPVASVAGAPSDAPKTFRFSSKPDSVQTKPGGDVNLGGLSVCVIDELDKADAVDGKLVENVPRGYKASNHLWSAADKTIRLRSARNEFIGFQILLSGRAEGVKFKATGLPQGVSVGFHREWYVPAGDKWLPDALLPLDGPLDVPSKLQSIRGQKHQGVFVDVYVPHDVKPGNYTGRIGIQAAGPAVNEGDGSVALKLELRIDRFVLPDGLNFRCELNSYSTPGPPAERNYYRLAHLHRATLNHLPYSQSGAIKRGCAPKLKNGTLDWTDWDRRFGQYFDGSAFSDLPRKNVPIGQFYLPLHENWPGNVFENYNGAFWADEAFPEAYRKLFVDVSRQIAQHINSKGWTRTEFQCYLNNKNRYRRTVRGSGSSPWVLDEPVDQNDFEALAYFAGAFREGVEDVKGDARIPFRLDISRPQWQRNTLDGLVGLTVCSTASFNRYRRIVLERAKEHGETVVIYGTTNKIDASNLDTAAWILTAWINGADGVVPWQTMGRNASWEKADHLSVLYPGERFGYEGAYPSMRLKAYRRGEQDIEYLHILMEKAGVRRNALARSVADRLRLRGKRTTDKAYAEDAGTVTFEGASSLDFKRLRTLLANEIEGR